MSVSELNELMTYVVDGWMLFSAGFIGTTFVSFVSKRIQEDMAAAELAQAEGVSAAANVELSAGSTGTVEVTAPPVVEVTATPSAKPAAAEGGAADGAEGDTAVEDEEAARLEEVAAVSEKLAKEKQKQSGSSSVSVST